MLDYAAGGENPEIEVRVSASQRPPNRALVQRDVLRVHDLAESLDGHPGSRFEVANPVELIRPVVLVSLEVRCEAARLAQSLGLGEMVVGPAKLCLGPLALGDICHRSNEF